MAEFVKVARADEISSGQGKLVEVGGRRIALFNVGGSFYAIDDMCTHRGGPLSEGVLSGLEVTCPWHGAAFNVTTGECTRFPATQAVARYQVRLIGDSVEVEV